MLSHMLYDSRRAHEFKPSDPTPHPWKILALQDPKVIEVMRQPKNLIIGTTKGERSHHVTSCLKMPKFDL